MSDELKLKACESVDGDFFAIYPDTGRMEFPIAVKPQFMSADTWREWATGLAAAWNTRHTPKGNPDE